METVVENVTLFQEFGWGGFGAVIGLCVTIVGTTTISVIVLLIKFFPNYNKLSDKIDKINTTLSAISTFLLQKFGDEYKSSLDSHEYTRAASPIVLTEKGSEAIKLSGIKEYIDSNANELIKRFDGIKTDKQALIHDTAQETAKDLLDSNNARKRNDEDILNIREHFYQKGVEQHIIERIFAVYLRDKVLERKSNQ